MFRRNRKTRRKALDTPIEMMLKGMTADQIAIAIQLAQRFDSSYEQLTDHLKSLGAEDRDYEKVNGTVKRFMGQARTDADPNDSLQMLVYSLGYENCVTLIKGLSGLPEKTRQAFLKAKSDAEQY